MADVILKYELIQKLYEEKMAAFDCGCNETGKILASVIKFVEAQKTYSVPENMIHEDD